jgi:hypothetical protein
MSALKDFAQYVKEKLGNPSPAADSADGVADRAFAGPATKTAAPAPPAAPAPTAGPLDPPTVSNEEVTVNPDGNGYTSHAIWLWITVHNETQSVLKLSAKTNEAGEFNTPPASEVGPGDSTDFGFWASPKGRKGSLTWAVGSPKAATWRCEWNYPLRAKPTANATLDKPAAGFKSDYQVNALDQYNQFPVDFTISGGEPDYDPPVAEKQPTLSKGDQSKDGWVEYLQQLLNTWLGKKLPTKGVFDADTYAAVKEFQRKHHCVDDGIVGNQTWAALRQGQPEKPSTDGRQPHTFEEKGAKARWYKEHDFCTYMSREDKLTLLLCSVGEENIEGRDAHVFVTPPGGGKRKGVVCKIGAPIAKTQTGEGNLHSITIDTFTHRFRSPQKDAKVEDYVLEAYFPEPGGDRWSGKVQVLE